MMPVCPACAPAGQEPEGNAADLDRHVVFRKRPVRAHHDGGKILPDLLGCGREIRRADHLEVVGDRRLQILQHDERAVLLLEIGMVPVVVDVAVGPDDRRHPKALGGKQLVESGAVRTA
jgi:hypothetical protein